MTCPFAMFADLADFKLKQLAADGSLECSVICEFHNKQLPPVNFRFLFFLKHLQMLMHLI